METPLAMHAALHCTSSPVRVRASPALSSMELAITSVRANSIALDICIGH
jgi:hypothetical protein